jgi:membrane protein implicated in regulation of membrane protease activity
MKSRKSLWMAIIGIFACAACCAFPVFTSLGSISMMALAAGWVKIAAVLLAIAALIGTVFLRKKKINRAVCSTDCNCKPKQCGAYAAAD